jgi:hypothetical protein
MMAMMGGPPKRPLLERAASEPRQAELKDAAGLVGLVRKVAMIAAGDAEHANEVKKRAQTDVHRVHAGAENRETGRMHGEERYGLQPCGLKARLDPAKVPTVRLGNLFDRSFSLGRKGCGTDGILLLLALGGLPYRERKLHDFLHPADAI